LIQNKSNYSKFRKFTFTNLLQCNGWRRSGNALVSINVVTIRRALLVLRCGLQEHHSNLR